MNQWYSYDVNAASWNSSINFVPSVLPRFLCFRPFIFQFRLILGDSISYRLDCSFINYWIFIVSTPAVVWDYYYGSTKLYFRNHEVGVLPCVTTIFSFIFVFSRWAWGILFVLVKVMINLGRSLGQRYVATNAFQHYLLLTSLLFVSFSFVPYILQGHPVIRAR